MQTRGYADGISGGSVQGDVAFSDQKITVPWVFKPDFLVAMAQDAVRQHAAAMRRGTCVIVDDILVTDVSSFRNGVAIHWAPLTQLADQVGFRKCTNIVALGVFSRLSGLLTIEEITKAVVAQAPGRVEINLKALRLGYDVNLSVAA